MPSHLTRHVFRRILANEPILHRACLRRQQHNGAVRRREGADVRPQLIREHGARQIQRRTVFNLASLFGKKREAAGASMDPGMDKLMELEKMQRLKARLPPPEDVAKALQAFARSRVDQVAHRGIEDNQAQLFLHGLRYCLRCDAERKSRSKDARDEPQIATRVLLRLSVGALRHTHKNITTSHIELGKALLECSKSRDRVSQRDVDKAFLAYVRMLALGGLPQDALDAVNDYKSAQAKGHVSAYDSSDQELSNQTQLSDDDANMLEPNEETDDGASSKTFLRALPHILRGFAMHGPHEKIETVLSMIREQGPLGFGGAMIMQEFSLQQDDFPSALHWWREGRRLLPQRNTSVTELVRMDNETESAKQAQQMLDWCLLRNEMEDGHRIVQELTASNPSKPDWDVIFVWAAGTKKSVDEIDRMIGIMVQSNEALEDRSQWRLPDIATINALVEAAISRDDPYMAERFIALGREKEIQPDAKTYVLQMDYRLRVGDVDGALIAYKNLQGLDLSSNEDLPTVNRLLVALCNTQRHDFDTIMNVAADLSDRRARFEPSTVATLSLLHLRRDERYDVIDLLNTHAYHFSSSERESIRNALVTFALDDNTPISRSWDTYTILRELFDEIPRTQRTDLMTAFMRRERPDMGVHVFQNMRMHSRSDTMPTIDTYVAAFMSLAKMRELDSLEVVHNQLKLDFNVQSSTYLLNALIVAYTACGKPRFALDYWDEIAISREGPSYNSVHVALRACEKAPFGDLKAQEIWSVLRKRGVELDQSLWASYAAALAGNGDNEMAFRALDEGVEKGEVEIDEFVLGSLFAAGANREKQEEMERWARERFESVWKGLLARGVETNIAGMRYFGIDRSVAP